MNRAEQEELIADLFEIVKELGWNIGIPGEEEDEVVSGLVIGTNDFINNMTEQFEMDVEYYEMPEKTEKH